MEPKRQKLNGCARRAKIKNLSKGLNILNFKYKIRVLLNTRHKLLGQIGSHLSTKPNSEEKHDASSRARN